MIGSRVRARVRSPGRPARARRDFGGFVIWRNGATSVFRGSDADRHSHRRDQLLTHHEIAITSEARARLHPDGDRHRDRRARRAAHRLPRGVRSRHAPGSRKAISVQEADRLAYALEKELVTLRRDRGSDELQNRLREGLRVDFQGHRRPWQRGADLPIPRQALGHPGDGTARHSPEPGRGRPGLHRPADASARRMTRSWRTTCARLRGASNRETDPARLRAAALEARRARQDRRSDSRRRRHRIRRQRGRWLSGGGDRLRRGVLHRAEHSAYELHQRAGDSTWQPDKNPIFTRNLAVRR